MIGIPYRLVQQTPEGPVDKTVYLRTRRSGAAGNSMRRQKDAFYAAEFACGRAAKRYEALDRKAREMDSTAPAFEDVVAKRDAAFDEIREKGNDATAAAEHLVRLALKENYADETDGIMDQLTDKDIRAMVTLIETGELPKDFFAAPEPPR